MFNESLASGHFNQGQLPAVAPVQTELDVPLSNANIVGSNDPGLIELFGDTSVFAQPEVSRFLYAVPNIRTMLTLFMCAAA